MKVHDHQDPEGDAEHCPGTEKPGKQRWREVEASSTEMEVDAVVIEEPFCQGTHSRIQ